MPSFTTTAVFGPKADETQIYWSLKSSQSVRIGTQKKVPELAQEIADASLNKRRTH